MMFSKKPNLSLVVPFYNDAGCPIPFVRELQEELKDMDYELILVDDCSSDTTPQELHSLKSKNIHVILNKKNLDYGGAIITGLKEAKGNIWGFTCGDGEISAEDIVRVYKEMKKRNSNIIKAVRQNREDGLVREIISKVFNLLSKIRFNLNIEDINGYPVFFKREVYEKVSKLRTDWIFNIDLLRKIIFKGYKVESVLVRHHKRLKGRSHMVPLRIAKMVIKYFKYK